MAEINLKPLPPQKAIEFFKDKGFQFTWNWHEMWNDDHNKAFTVAKVTTLDILQDIRDAVTAALKEGTTFKEFADVLIPTLQSKGWWGKQEADGKTVQLGSPWRLETIFRTNIQSAFQVGHYRDMTSQEVKKARPFWEYVAVLDSRTRPKHAKWDGTILPHDDKWWDTHYPPNGWNCRCTVRTLSQRQMDRKGLSVSKRPNLNNKDWKNPDTGKVEKVPDGIDPGFAFNPGKKDFKPGTRQYDPDIRKLFNS